MVKGPRIPDLDRITRIFWSRVGRKLDFSGESSWLSAPMHSASIVGADWLESAAADMGGRVVERPDAGLLADMSVLDGPMFTAADLRPEIRDFYEHTARWRMEVWTQWSPLFQPGGELISRLFGQRVQQLAIPTRPLDVARGMDSRVAVIVDADGVQRAAGWMRTLRGSGEFVYSGCYSHRILPECEQPSIHVAFPLESGNVQVFLQPTSLPDGSLSLTSTKGPFGSNGAYVAVNEKGRDFAARVPLHETFHVYVDDEGILRTDHVLRMWSAVAVRLHYKLARTGAVPD